MFTDMMKKETILLPRNSIKNKTQILVQNQIQEQSKDFEIEKLC